MPPPKRRYTPVPPPIPSHGAVKTIRGIVAMQTWLRAQRSKSMHRAADHLSDAIRMIEAAIEQGETR